MVTELAGFISDIAAAQGFASRLQSCSAALPSFASMLYDRDSPFEEVLAMRSLTPFLYPDGRVPMLHYLTGKPAGKVLMVTLQQGLIPTKSAANVYNVTTGKFCVHRSSGNYGLGQALEEIERLTTDPSSFDASQAADKTLRDSETKRKRVQMDELNEQRNIRALICPSYVDI